MHIIKIIAFTFTILLTQVLSGQIRVTPVEIGKNITSLRVTDQGALLYGTADGEVGIYDGIMTKSIANIGTRPLINSIAATRHLYTSRGLVSIENGVKTLSSPNLNILTASPDGLLLVSTSGIFKKQGPEYVLSDEKNLPNRADINRAEYFEYKKTPYLLINTQLYKKELRWQLVQDSILDVANVADNLYYLKAEGIQSEEGEVLYYHNATPEDRIFAGIDHQLLLMSNNLVTMVTNGQGKDIYSISTTMVTDVVQDGWDNYWIAAGSYLYRITQTNTTKPLSPTLQLISINGLAPNPKTKLEEKDAILEVKYKGVQLTKPQQLTYQSKLEGFSDWSSPGKEETIKYEHIPAGKYHYQLRATTDGTNFTYSPRHEVMVTDSTAYTIWVGLLLAGLGIFLTAFITNRRYTAQKEKNDAERLKLINQNRILTLQQKSLQLQMNPHFIFNALNSIKGLIAKGESKLARKSLTDFAQLMRITLQQSRADSISVADEVQYLDQYLRIEQWTNEYRFNYEIEVDETVDTELHIPTMLLQPFAENAVKHAFKGKKEKGNIRIRMWQHKSSLYCKIEDDGIGIQAVSDSTHDSVALEVVRERLGQQRHSSANDLQIESPLASGGTKVTICIRLKGY